MKKFAICILAMHSLQVMAGYGENVKVENLTPSHTGFVYLTINGELNGNICSHFDWNIKFDGSTDGGKNMYSALLAADMADRKVKIWFADSTNPTDCSEATLATLESVLLQ